ncbi:uncharacterized protein LOC106871251 [Octopus bimaculoides]|uniref:Lipocalin/cytosolic fatty-acid binding domain-containing protein n=1 Tax=Octopus bimaculoides TaxID=37653 RepID=A0A0L8HFD1_OCTBM|nr:uncharacterized protein LOC106871251 [Octopus bimaculoides]|eukprot:XP_014773091.1 PREDICTED: uncharacterized protein LOC106871251 [Octopus bimaculoides]
MGNFIGKWEQFDEDLENADAFFKAAGLNDESKIEEMKKTRAIMECQKDGDGYKSIYTDMNSGMSKEYHFKIGEPFESDDLHGKKFKGVITIESPTKIKECYTEWSPTEIITIREVDGDILTVTFTAKGVSAKCRAKKI